MSRGLGIRIRWGGVGCRWVMAIGHVASGGVEGVEYDVGGEGGREVLGMWTTMGGRVTMSARVRRASLKGIAEVGRRWKREGMSTGACVVSVWTIKKRHPCICLFGSSEYISITQAHPGNPRNLLPQPPLPHPSFSEDTIPLSAEDYQITTLFRVTTIFDKI